MTSAATPSDPTPEATPASGPAGGTTDGRRPTALVTGATAGLGAGFADRLAARGHDLVLVARDESRLASTAAALRARHGVEVEVLSADLSDRAALERVAQRVADPARPVDVLVNNAGFGLRQRFVDGVPADHERMFDVLCRAVMVLSRAAAGAMVPRGRGRVLNVGSVAGLVPGGGHYSAAKAYVIVLTETLAGELRGTGVTATVVAPGYVRTEFHDRSGMRKGGRSALSDRVWLDVADVVDAALDDLFAGRAVSVPTRRWAVVATVVDVLPRGLVSRVWNRMPGGAARRYPTSGA
ncbi:SDR family NAD(P)-dependent oxidoreductase [Kineococcus sp. R8]|uniref:SDR family NAD(P)-dependent oxidoreductase n=1 Tax=Kineococcus siccus TaxID=2696567 RepID=UPI0014129B28|nr:SDR family oxidoreductase [Kineococcus siccus]NAZ83709.1 SDR family NAD(P)-dependent oxidoreductase [Kineococcus siccus]